VIKVTTLTEIQLFDIYLQGEREKAIETLKDWIDKASVEYGAKEEGAYVTYNVDHGHNEAVEIIVGSAAGSGSKNEFEYAVPVKDNLWILAWAHTHPSYGTGVVARSMNRLARRPSRMDRRLMKYAPLVLKGPDGKLRTFTKKTYKPLFWAGEHQR
jgi:proteasome lid subunit RPN8/RPN11